MLRPGMLIPLILLTVVSCATTKGVEITEGNNRIVMPHYTITASPYEGWRLETPEGQGELAVLTKEQASTPLGPVAVEIKFMRNVLLDPALRTKTAREVADDFRNLEKTIMIEQGVNKGLYELSDVTMDEAVVGGKKFYFMDYNTRSSNTVETASLYLFFPKEQGNDGFIVAHYSESIPLQSGVFKTSRRSFIRMIGTLEVR